MPRHRHHHHHHHPLSKRKRKTNMAAQGPSSTTISVGAPNVTYYTPVQTTASGTISPAEKTVPLVFQPLKIRGLELPNRIMVRPKTQACRVDLIFMPCPPPSLDPLLLLPPLTSPLSPLFSLRDNYAYLSIYPNFVVLRATRSPQCASTRLMRS